MKEARTDLPNPLALPTEFEKKFTRLDGIARDPKMLKHFLYDVLWTIWDQNVDYVEVMVNPFDRVKQTADSVEFAFGSDSDASYGLKRLIGDEQFDFTAALLILQQYIDVVRALNESLFIDNFAHPGDLKLLKEGKHRAQWKPRQLDARFLIGLKRSSLNRKERLREAFELVDHFAKTSNEKYRSQVVGINLIGDEFGVVGRPTDYLEWMLPLLEQYPSVHVSLHAGESSIADGHVLDSILLGAQRIGHGLSLQFSSRAEEIVKDRDICIETCLLSNKILGFVPDVESHPAKKWIRRKLKVSLNTDDPGIFETTLADEFYYATVAFNLSLRDIKKLATEGILSSFAPNKDKNKLIKQFSDRFNSYVLRYHVPQT